MALTVLLVDDEPVFLTYIRQMEFWGTGEFVCAGEVGSADEALEFLKKKETDIIVMDVSMPGKSGVELSSILSRQYPQLSIVAMSSYDDYDYVREILKNGAHDYLLKSRLSEEFFLLTLKNVEKRLKGRTPWDAKRELRRQAGEWFMENGLNPFPSENSRKIAVIITINNMVQTGEDACRSVLEGIGKIAESMTTEQKDILACPKEPNTIILLFRFYGIVSEAEMKRQIECDRMLIQEGIKKIYHLGMEFFQCPFFFSDQSLKSFLLHKLEAPEKMPHDTASLSLSIGQHKRLLAAVEDHDGGGSEQLIRKIYSEIAPDDMRLCIMVTRELLDLLEKASIEYQIKLDFLPREFMLFQYARVKTRKELVSNIVGLYRNVLREIGELESRKLRYSAMVQNAIAYQKEHFMEPISLRTVADGIGVSSSYLSRMFHEETGETITDYLNGIRLEEAKRLMKEGVALKEIVGRCGFRNYGYFLRIFKEYTGKTPKEYMSE